MPRPRHDPPSKLPPRRLGLLARMARGAKRRPPREPNAGGEPCPVDPNHPLNLSGGAAAALEFGD